MAKKIVAGNWKMNLTKGEASDLVNALNDIEIPNDVEVIVFPSHVLIDSVASFISKQIQVGAQNFNAHDSGAYTGENSISQLKSVGAVISLIGHSERRSMYGETNDVLKRKVNQAIQQNFPFIFCCGEPLEIREAQIEVPYVLNQLEESLYHLSAEKMRDVIIAYEPVWAIGTGKTASAEQAEEMHQSVRMSLTAKYGDAIAQGVTILYGGSCNAGNARELFSKPNVDGGLIGGASLKCEDFAAIIDSF